MKEKKIVSVLIAVFAVVIIGAGFLYNYLGDKNAPDISAPESGETSDAVLNKAPDFTVTDVNGNEVKLSDMVGKPVVINFWATWCGFCKQEMPVFQEVYEEMGDDVVFMMVNATDGKRETVEIAKEYIEENKYSFPVYFDTLGEAAYNYGLSSLPATYFVDAEGNAVTYARGAMSRELLLKGIGFINSEE